MALFAHSPTPAYAGEIASSDISVGVSAAVVHPEGWNVECRMWNVECGKWKMEQDDGTERRFSVPQARAEEMLAKAVGREKGGFPWSIFVLGLLGAFLLLRKGIYAAYPFVESIFRPKSGNI
jgi:hypothetical protein